jgi:amidase
LQAEDVAPAAACAGEENMTHRLSVTQLAAAMRAGETTSLRATETMLERIQRLDPLYNSYAAITAEAAIAAARQADAEFARGVDRGPLQGIPVALKDLIDTSDAVTACGTKVMANRRPADDATVVVRLRNAGAVILGKLKMTESAIATHHPAIPSPINPWNPDRTPGYSSSGAGVAVAADLCTAALGTDTGGSIRIPAAANGITGLKPTWGRVSRAGLFPLVEGLDTIGPMARSAADVAAVLGVIAGRDGRDPTSSLEPVPDYLVGLAEPPQELRIGIDRRWLESVCTSEVLGLFEEAVGLMADLGSRFVAVELPPLDPAKVLPLFAAGLTYAHRDLYPAAGYGPDLAARIEAGRRLDAVTLYGAVVEAQQLKASILTLFDGVDLLMTPAFAGPTPMIGNTEPPSRERPSGAPAVQPMMWPFNISGTPAIVFPSNVCSDGMPFCIQLAAAPYREGVLLQATHRVQTVTDWHLRRPVGLS